MAELRRLLVESQRFEAITASDHLLSLKQDEVHYLRRVLRLRNGQAVAVVDGVGHFWEAHLQAGDFLKLDTSPSSPSLQQPRHRQQLGLAVVLPKRGFEEVLRMSCELGVNLIQPLRSDRCTPQAEERPLRWKVILREAVEQSEQLWQPELLPIAEASALWKSPPDHAVFALATTRRQGLIDLQLLMEGLTPEINQVTVAIGPEGGWSPLEECAAEAAGWVPVALGDSILRTCTAAVAAAQTMVSSRRISLSRDQSRSD